MHLCIIIKGTEERENKEPVCKVATEPNIRECIAEHEMVQSVEEENEKVLGQSVVDNEPLQDTKDEEITIEYTDLEKELMKDKTVIGKLCIWMTDF